MRMYAARSIPFGLLAGTLPFRLGGLAAACILFIAAAIQVVDVWIATRKQDRKMVIGASIGATVHFLCGIAILQVGARGLSASVLFKGIGSGMMAIIPVIAICVGIQLPAVSRSARRHRQQRNEASMGHAVCISVERA